MVLLFALVSVELGVTVAGVCIQLQHRWAAKSLARSCREDLVLRPRELFAVCQWRVCRAGSSNVITVFAFLVLSLSWLPGFADHSEFFLGNIPVLSWSGHVGVWPVAGRCSAFLYWYFSSSEQKSCILLIRRCIAEGGFLRWHVIGRPGILVPGSSQAFGCPSHLHLSLLWILHTA